jgi:RNA polymerase sigma-70 factor (ECF subfamily)
MEAPPLPGGDETRLVAEAREGSERAFRKLVERYHPMTYSIVRAILGDRFDVEDVVQDVFVKVYGALRQFRGESKLSSWIYQIARNEALNQTRGKRPAAEPLDDAALETPIESRPDEQYRRKMLREDLERCLMEIDEEFRTVLEMRYMGEMSYAEISDATGLPMGTVKTYIHRAKIELKRVMTRRRFVETYKLKGQS